MPRITRVQQQNFDDMKRARGIDFAYIGMHVEVDGKRGVICGSYSHNLLVNLAGYNSPVNCHPTWKVKYFANDNTLVREYGEG